MSEQDATISAEFASDLDDPIWQALLKYTGARLPATEAVALDKLVTAMHSALSSLDLIDRRTIVRSEYVASDLSPKRFRVALTSSDQTLGELWPYLVDFFETRGIRRIGD